MGLNLEKFKPLIGIEVADNTKDGLLMFILEDVEQTIFNYCNLQALPKGLETTAYKMAIDIYRNENLGSSEHTGGAVTSIKEGDISVNFNQGSYVDGDYKNTLMKGYQEQLNSYRRLRW